MSAVANLVFLNGRFLPLEQASISPLDRGFLFGDGIYEVIPVYHHVPFGLEAHVARLIAGLKSVHIPNPYTAEQWSLFFLELIEHNRHEGDHFSLYCQVTRGQTPRRTLEVPLNNSPTVFAMITPFHPPKISDLVQGMKVITAPDLRSHHTHIKSTSLLATTLMRLQAQEREAAEVIVIHGDHVVEAISSNVFMVHQGAVYTPPLSPRLVGGVTREKVLQLCQEHQIPYFETPCTRDFLLHADEVWLSGSIKEIVPVVQIDETLIGTGIPGPLWHQMIDWYKARP